MHYIYFIYLFIYIYLFINNLKLQNLKACISITLIKNRNAHGFLQILNESK